MYHRMLLDARANVRIQVRGSIGPQWSEYFQDLTISTNDDRARAVTTLSGEVQDQAALLGIINSLYQLGYPLISVESLEQASM